LKLPHVLLGPSHSKKPESAYPIPLPWIRPRTSTSRVRPRTEALTCAGPWQVIYKEKDADSQPSFWLVEGNSSRSVQLTGLGKYVLYEVRVLAFTRVGDGSPSHPPVLERTLDDGKFKSQLTHARRNEQPSILPRSLASWCPTLPQRRGSYDLQLLLWSLGSTNPSVRGC
jgi:hypothetical protein